MPAQDGCQPFEFVAELPPLAPIPPGNQFLESHHRLPAVEKGLDRPQGVLLLFLCDEVPPPCVAAEAGHRTPPNRPGPSKRPISGPETAFPAKGGWRKA